MITCPRCAGALPDWLLRTSHTASICPQCQAPLDIYCFPALYHSPEKIDLSRLAIGEGDACCYEHATKKASTICSHCGRFLCALCEVPLAGGVFCPDCVNKQKGTTQQDTLDTDRTLYDSIAFALATWPMLIFYFTVFTAPLSLGMAIYGWKRPMSIVRRSRWRLYSAVVIASLQLLGIAATAIFLIYTIAHEKARP